MDVILPYRERDIRDAINIVPSPPRLATDLLNNLIFFFELEQMTIMSLGAYTHEIKDILAANGS